MWTKESFLFPLIICCNNFIPRFPAIFCTASASEKFYRLRQFWKHLFFPLELARLILIILIKINCTTFNIRHKIPLLNKVVQMYYFLEHPSWWIRSPLATVTARTFVHPASVSAALLIWNNNIFLHVKFSFCSWLIYINVTIIHTYKQSVIRYSGGVFEFFKVISELVG